MIVGIRLLDDEKCMPITKIGIIADIHANAWAIEAVLDDAKRRGITEFVDLGDVLYGPLQPRRTYDLFKNVDLRAGVQGNQDRLIYEPAAQINPTLEFVVGDLGPEPIEWLRQLPKTIVFEDDIFLFHGTPANDTTTCSCLPGIDRIEQLPG